MNTVRMILCGNVEDSRMNPSEKVGVVSVVYVLTLFDAHLHSRLNHQQ